MDDSMSNPSSEARRQRRQAGLSYKFQRLREALRAAIETGELTGRLPGERELAKRFGANAKTLGKALTDLAAEGLLERSIGRGTFVKGAGAPAGGVHNRRLILIDPEAPQRKTVQLLLEACPGAQVCADASAMRPSFVNQFSAVVDFSARTPDAVLRDLVVRNIPVVAVGHEPRNYATHAVLIDRTFGAGNLARDLILGGHRRLAAIEAPGADEIAIALRRVAARHDVRIHVESTGPDDVLRLVEDCVSAVVCDGAESARRVRRNLGAVGLSTPQSLCVSAVGLADDEAPCTGYFVSCEQEAATILQLLNDTSARRPSSLWLVGSFIERMTVVPAARLQFTHAGAITELMADAM